MTDQTHATAPKRAPVLLRAGWLAVIFNALSLFSLLNAAFEFGLSEVFEVVLSYYNHFLSTILWPFEQVFNVIVIALNWLVPFELEFYDHWRHPMFIVALYFFTDLRVSFFGRALPAPMIRYMVISSASIIPAVGLIGGLVPLNGTLGIVAITPIAAFTLFELAKCPMLATHYRSNNETYLPVFAYYFVFYAAASAALGAIAYLIAPDIVQVIAPTTSVPTASSVNVAVLVIFLILIVLRNIMMAAIRPLFLPATEPWLQRFLSSGSFRTAANLIYTFIMLSGFLALNATYK